MANANATSTKILGAATELFSTNAYSEISVDEIARKAGFTKMTVYQYFRSKDQLFLECLTARLERREMKLDQFLGSLAAGADPLLAVFDWLEDWLDPCNFKGCAFVKAFNELSAIVPEVRKITFEAKEKLRLRLISLARKSGRLHPSELGTELALLCEGAQSLASIQGNAQPARVARRIACALLNR